METIYIVGHKNPDTDTICSAIALTDLLKKLKEAGNEKFKILFPIGEADIIAGRQGELNEETSFVLEKANIEVPKLIESAKGKKFILVDHNEKKQSFDDIDEAEIIAIIDHHKIGDITTKAPITFINLPLGSTATIIKLLYDYFSIEIDKRIALLLLSAILSDTVIFKSPTTTEIDKKVANELKEIAGIEDIVKFGIEIKSKLSNIEKLSAREIIKRDFKEYNMGNRKVGIGQIEVVDVEIVKGRIDEIYEEMKKIKEEEGYHTIVLMITDIMKEGTLLLAISDEMEKVKKAFGEFEREIWLPGVMSRKKQVTPKLEEVFS